MSPFTLIADPHRRAILDLLRERERAVGELVESLGIAQPAVSKHLRVLREAGAVHARIDAQRRVYRIDPGPLRELDEWLAPTARCGTRASTRCERELDQMTTQETLMTATPTLHDTAGGPQLRLTRRLAHPPEKVWRAITEAEHLAARFRTRSSWSAGRSGLYCASSTRAACTPSRVACSR